MRFASRQEESFAAKVIAALRNEFGGHAVRPEGHPPPEAKVVEPEEQR
jgi:6-phosphogluconate dehydrogenase